jgi:hypothetical protein
VEAQHRQGWKIGAAAAFYGELAVLVAGGVMQQGGKEWAQAQLNLKKGRQGGVLMALLTVEALDGRGGRSSDEMAPSRVFQAGQEATGVNEIPSAPLNRTDV